MTQIFLLFQNIRKKGRCSPAPAGKSTFKIRILILKITNKYLLAGRDIWILPNNVCMRLGVYVYMKICLHLQINRPDGSGVVPKNSNIY